ncbi:MAG: sodium:proton antiporter [Microbacteriaceae bacterium]|jgi:hypothetical protein|nr:sodium:proton antiporter [Microbacteriaceae bacterium]
MNAERDHEPPDRRNETEVQRYDRNWNEILQELRVTQTGTQILTGFLLTIAFQNRFSTLDKTQVVMYLVLVVLASASATLALLPVSLHRMLFRQGAKGEMVQLANRILIATLAVVGLVVVGVVAFIFDAVVSTTAGVIAGAVALIVIVVAWIALPIAARDRGRGGYRA